MGKLSRRRSIISVSAISCDEQNIYIEAVGLARHSSIAGDPWLRLYCQFLIMSRLFDSLLAKNKVQNKKAYKKAKNKYRIVNHHDPGTSLIIVLLTELYFIFLLETQLMHSDTQAVACLLNRLVILISKIILP